MKKKLHKEIFANIKKSFKLMKGSKKNLIIYLLLNLITIPISIVLPIYTAKIVLNISNGDYQNLFKAAIVVCAIRIISNLINFLSTIFYQKYILNASLNINKLFIQKVFDLEVKTFDNNSSGIFTSRLESDTHSIITVFNKLNFITTDILSNIGILIITFRISKIIFTFFILQSIYTFIINSKRIKKANKKYDDLKDTRENNSGLINELFRGIRDIKVLNASSLFINKYDERISNENKKSYDYIFFNNRSFTIKAIVGYILEFAFYVIGIILVKNNLLIPSDFLVLYMYRPSVIGLLGFLANMMDSFNDFNLSAKRVFEVIDGDTFTKEKFGNKNIKKVKGDFEFKNVSFSYNDKKDALKDISFKVKANTTTAFVGKSGSGKTTIFNLLDKLYNTNKGNIYIDGIDINELSKESIRNNISVITQSPYIFNLTIRENLLLASNNVSEKEMINACKTACIHDFIMNLPDGYDTKVGEGGVTLSGGERQRIAIARALIRKTEIILFDEATSALDNETQEQIQKAIHNLKGEYTILIIAHRLSTIKNSDNIIMLEKGKIVASGTHNELIKNSKKYYNLYHSEDEK